ncbi:hypothetical protein ACSOV8_08980 [Bacillus halotolerans]
MEVAWHGWRMAGHHQKVKWWWQWQVAGKWQAGGRLRRRETWHSRKHGY